MTYVVLFDTPRASKKIRHVPATFAWLFIECVVGHDDPSSPQRGTPPLTRTGVTEDENQSDRSFLDFSSRIYTRC